MILHVSGLTMHIDCTQVNDPPPKTPEEKVTFAKDALAEINNQLKRKYGIWVTAFIEAGDIN